MSTTNVAKIIDWNDAKGYGFARANGIKYFVHISALGPVSRSPKIGDTIIVTQFLDTPKGCRITSGTLEGVPLKELPEKRTPYARGYFRKRKLKFALFLAIVSIPLMVYQCSQKLIHEQEGFPEPVAEFRGNENMGDNYRDNSESNFNCDGRKYCSQMKSYEEALYFLRHCPGTQMDGDGDGIPCERQFGR